MSNTDRIQQAAGFLFEEHQARRPFSPIPESCAPRSADEAYATQEEFVALLAGIRGPVSGYKIALTTPVMQQMVGYHEPFAGGILAHTIHQTPIMLRSTDYVHLGVECEIAVQLGADLPAALVPYSRERVAEAVTTMMPAFELIDDRNADYSKLAKWVLSCIADNAWNAGIALGQPVADWRTVDLAAARGALHINGALVGEGCCADVMGHPLDAVVWLADMAAKRGKDLTRGMIIMTGSIITTRHLNPGDSARLAVDGLGEVNLSVS